MFGHFTPVAPHSGKKCTGSAVTAHSYCIATGARL